MKRKVSQLTRLRQGFGRRATRQWKHWRQAVSCRAGNARPLFIVGCQRSGTNMLQQTLDRSPSIWVYNEDNRRAFDNYRIKGLADRRRLIEKAHCAWVVFKPLCDCQNIDRLMDEHPDGKVIWTYRRYQDVANSAIRNFSDDQQLRMIRHAATDEHWNHWLVERMPPDRRDLVRELYSDKMTIHTAAALKWYLRNEIYFDYQLASRVQARLVCYEQLAQSPQDHFHDIFEFIELPFESRFSSNVVGDSISKNQFPAIDDRVASLCDELMQRLACSLNGEQTERVNKSAEASS